MEKPYSIQEISERYGPDAAEAFVATRSGTVEAFATFFRAIAPEVTREPESEQSQEFISPDRYMGRNLRPGIHIFEV